MEADRAKTEVLNRALLGLGGWLDDILYIFIHARCLKWHRNNDNILKLRG